MKIHSSNKIRYIIITTIRSILLVFVSIVTYNFFLSTINTYKAPWGSMYFENSDIGTFIGSFFYLQIMYFLRFPFIRNALLLVGTLSLILLILKFYTQPIIINDDLDLQNGWPFSSDIKSLCAFCVLLIIEGVLFPYVKKFFDFIIIKPIIKIVLLIKKYILKIVSIFSNTQI